MLTTADIKTKQSDIKLLKEQKMDESNMRKKVMQQLEEKRKKNEKPSDLEEVRGHQV